MKKFLAIGFVLLLAACAGEGHSSYVAGMQKYQSASEKQLVTALGPPDQSYEVDGTKYLTYSKTEQYVDNPDPTYGIGGGGVYGGNGVFVNQGFGTGRVQNWRCDVFFIIRNHKVDNIGHRGNSC
jgi:hypothetical protein